LGRKLGASVAETLPRGGTNATPLNPILRWAGSKRKVLPVLSQFWRPDFKRYVEPFAGSASLFFRLQPARALLGDINRGLIETYKVICERPDDVYNGVARIPGNETRYYQLRRQDPEQLPLLDRAIRFVYLNRFCFNGILRTNTQGHFNVPFAPRIAHCGNGHF
jgi:DNA adenine methylase